MERELYEILRDRAKYFLKISEEDAKNLRYDIALFHIEQALQLALKAYLLKTKGDFPKVHDLFTLIELTDNKEVKKIADEKWYVVNILIDAYLASRYFLRKYSEREFRESYDFARRVFECLNI